MSTNQSDLREFDSSSPKNPANSGRGTPVADRADRPRCGYEDTNNGSPCAFPVAPGQGRCHRHMEDSPRTDSQDVGPLLSAVKGSPSDVGESDAVHCPNGHHIPAMYRPMCPECGARHGGD